MKPTQAMLKQMRIRRSRRGAALVEGALLFPVMVLFLVYMTSFHNLHKVEFQVMAEARRQAWDLASHGCQAGGNGGSTSTSSPNNPTNVQGGQTGTVMTGIVGYAKGSSSGTSNSGPYGRSLPTRSIAHDVFVPCNENVNAGDNMFVQMYNIARSMGTGVL